jgi:hypothetical protein
MIARCDRMIARSKTPKRMPTMINPDYPTLNAYLADDLPYLDPENNHNPRDMADLEMHAANLETALVNLHRHLLNADTINPTQLDDLISAISDNAHDVAADDLFTNDCRTYRN